MKSANSARILGMTRVQLIILCVLGLFAFGIVAAAVLLLTSNTPLSPASPAPLASIKPTAAPTAAQQTATPIPTAAPTLTPKPIPASQTPTQKPSPSPAATQSRSAAGLLYFNGPNGCEIRRINVQDGSTKQIGHVPPNLCTDWNQKTWAPDGSQFALATRTGDPGSPLFSIQILKQDGSAAYQLVSGSGMIGAEGLYWSPDGKRLAYVLYDYDADLFSLNLVFVDGRDHSHGDFLTLTGPPINLQPTAGGAYVSWAPDGQHLLAHAVGAAGKNGLYQISSQENISELLKGSAILTSKPRWSPDGKHILFNDDYYSWKIIALEGDGRPQPFFDAGTFLAWAPDGSEVFAITHPENAPAQLLAYPAAGGQPPRVIAAQNVPNLQGWNPNALWSPDQKLLAFWNMDQVYLLDLETGAVRSLNISVRTEEGFAWSPPGVLK